MNDHFVDVYDSHIEQEEHEDFCPEVAFTVLWEGRISANFQAGRVASTARSTSPNGSSPRTGSPRKNGKYLETRIVFRAFDQE